MSSHHCSIQRHCSLSIDRAAAPPNYHVVALYRSVAGAQCWVCNRNGWFLCWGVKTRHIKKQRDRGGVGLRWLPFGKKSNNLQTVGRKDRRDDGEGVQLGRSVQGGCCLFMRGSKLSNAKNTTINYVKALDGHVTIFHMQQPTKNTQAQWSRCTRAGVTRGECAGGWYHRFGGH